MTIRHDALDHLRARLAADAGLRKRVGFGPEGVHYRSGPNCTPTSRVYPPEESATKAWAWWHSFPEGNLESEGHVALVCQERDAPGFRILAVPYSWLQNNRDSLAYSGGEVVLHLSAETDDLFTDGRAGAGGLDFTQWVVE